MPTKLVNYAELLGLVKQRIRQTVFLPRGVAKIGKEPI